MRLKCWWFIIVLLATLTTQTIGCPPPCACKWKGGKEAVECANRSLTRIPQGAAEETQVLDLSSNHLVKLQPEAFRNLGLVNLQKLYLSKSNITHISPQAFVGLVGLVELDLSVNSIIDVPSETFSSCPSLMRLILSGNPIRRLSRDAFKPLTQLTTLELSKCQLASIEQGAFNGLQSLEWLRLNDNRLTYIPDMTLPLTGNLHGLTLHNNPWLCNCRLRPMQDWLKQSAQAAPQESDPVCEAPPRLHQRPIKTIKLDDLACLPEIHTEQLVEVDEGANVTLRCNVYAIPVATISWWINGQKCETQKDNDSSTSAYVRYICKQQGLTNSTNLLHLFNADKSDEGTFTCTAENTAGTVDSNLSIRVKFQERSTVEPPFENTNTSYVAAVAAGALVGTLLALGCVIGGIIVCAKRRRDQKRNDKSLSSQSKVSSPIVKESETLPHKTVTDTLNFDNHQQVMYTERELQRTASLDRRETVEAYRGPVPKYLTEPDLINEVYPSTNPPSSENYTLYQHQRPQPRGILDYADTRYSLQPTIDRPSLSQIPYLDQDGYPLNFGLPKISLNPVSCTLPRLRHRIPEGSAAAPTARYTREAEFLARTPHDPAVLSRPDTRYTADGYPYPIAYQPITSPVRQPLQIPPYVSPEIAMPEVSDVPFIPSPPAAYKGEPTPLSPRSLMSKTAHEAAAAVAARADDPRPPDHPESPDEGYVGDAMDV
ncbi:leucine-rich repeat-containing protein 24 [Fopius arisanus]|uniref:Leucine-rich repeat-containing protein 24 n=1 Tax=Fopius arisanus TaxID=64838 RepID=A0A9R1TZD7_9HYME|nr:PREDICTED: leucine-rich repeat-containing protein 24-like [Fopius arisanus]XP_011303431.1 PREDICTED: leucine-rich repeat-containing protein 24-like [Fopius arisanus]